jgi:hypothetical protein
MSQANWLWGAPRFHGELLKLGFEACPWDETPRYLVRERDAV